MTPKQREIVADFQVKISQLDTYVGFLRRQLQKLPDYFDSDSAQDKGEFTAEEISKLLCFNQRLSALEGYLCEMGAKECLQLDVRVSDPNDPLDDYEIEATLYFTLGEDDPAFDADEDNFLTQRQIGLKRLNREWGLGDGQDHRETVCFYPGDLNEAPHCWLFHDLNDHDYGLEQPALTLQDCLRVDSIWVDIAVHQPAMVAIKTGQWLPPNQPDK
ncbi:MAG: hypothetical protein PHY16_11785 [Methylobacter sp.]|nr:hypothetical protein [Methylobacter sp.]